MREGNLLFFVGAGISKAPPAQLPLSKEIVREIIHALSRNEFLFHERKKIFSDLENIRLEVLLQLMYEQIGKTSLETCEEK